MIKKHLLVICSLCVLWASAQSNPYLVCFKDKPDVSFDPYKYFHPDAIQAKTEMGLPLYDWYDLPLNKSYVTEVTKIADSVGFSLRWFNGKVVYAGPDVVASISNFPFVANIIPLYPNLMPTYNSNSSTPPNEDLDIFRWQLQTLGLSYFEKKKLNGKGIKICVLDVGFKGAPENEALKHQFNNRKESFAWDFARNKSLNFSTGHQHGNQVASFISGKIKNNNVGLAPNSTLIFGKMNAWYKSNRAREDYWLKGVEWAHQQGARLLNSSLGYSGNFNHKHELLTGDSCLMSRAANLAARKGLLVISSAGNEGSNLWKRIAFPGDADSALTVGAISPKTGIRTEYSSYGPTYNSKLKPNVSALGDVYWWNGNTFSQISGTSFSSPLVTGFAACVLQDNPSLKPMDLIDTIQKSSTLFPYFDYSHGYGVPQASKYLNEDTIANDTATIKIVESPNYLRDGYYSFEYVKHNNSQFFYQILNKDGVIKSYYVVRFKNKDEAPKIPFEDLNKGDIIRVKHRGTFIELIHK